jgi:gamma-glutamylcyclotransferase (GGCT)/AIG2-like uncharacterized protein YtfP
VEAIRAIFVYGTLKRGEVRERCWPRKPLDVVPAVTQGALYDLGRYPALVVGDDDVSGEVWRLANEDVAVTLEALDEIEGWNGQENDEYRRAAVPCQWERSMFVEQATLNAAHAELCPTL